jgi:Ni/Co efflux regulator RcnB
MKKIILAAAALALLATPSLAAERFRPQAHYQPAGSTQVIVKKPNGTVVIKQRQGGPQVVVKPRWSRGDRLSAAQRRHVIRDYRHAGLKAPARGQQWVQVDNDFVLIGITSGIIAGIIAAH